MSENSITLVAAVAAAENANQMFDGLGFGRMLAVQLSPDGSLPATHLACHDRGPDERVALYQAMMDSSDPALSAMGGVTIVANPGGAVFFAEAIAGLGLMIYEPPDDV